MPSGNTRMIFCANHGNAVGELREDEDPFDEIRKLNEADPEDPVVIVEFNSKGWIVGHYLIDEEGAEVWKGAGFEEKD